MVKTKIFLNIRKKLLRFIRQKDLRVLGFSLFSVLLFLFPYPNIYFQSVSKTSGMEVPQDIKLPPPPPYPINNTGKPAPSVTAEGVIIKDISSGAILYSKNEKKRFPPASTTKIISALVAMDYYHLDDVLVVKTIANSGRTMGLIPREKLTVESLLYGTLVHSANDAAFALAENYPGGVAKFVEKMNEKAKSLHLTDTYFANPIGFDNSNQYTTAWDLTKQAQAALDNKTFVKMVGTKSITVSDVSFTYFHELKNVNELLGKVAGVSGVKTGFTQAGLEILVTEVTKNGKSVLFVLLKSKDRFGETTKLIDWVFDNFRWENIRDIITPTTQQLQLEDTL